jgi:2-keto-4-pentenoate hydratase/2-oxohepta-3-ene-1,7-dioic acid hydratase in catechol pathway
MQYVTTAAGIGRVADDQVQFLDVPWRDVGSLLWERHSLDALSTAPVRRTWPLDDTILRAPVPRPGKIWGVALNYRSHAAETGRPVPTEPTVFVKVTSSVVGPTDPVRLPSLAPTRVDHECEVAVVIGRPASDIPASAAWSYVAGITACNDVTARDIQRGTGNFGLAKSFDTFCPLGGSLVTPDEFDDLDDIGLSTRVNGTLVQQGSTADMVFPIPELIAWLSRHTTLEPGDVITTGTPAGVGEPVDRFLRPGDLVEVRIDRVLPLLNRVVGP